MSKYLIVNTSTYAATGPGSVPGRVLLGADNIISIIPTAATALEIVYQGNVRAVLTFSAAIKVGDYSVITFLTKEIEKLQSGGSSTLSLPTTFPNCFSTVGHPISISGISVSQPCCTP